MIIGAKAQNLSRFRGAEIKENLKIIVAQGAWTNSNEVRINRGWLIKVNTDWKRRN